MFQSGVLLFSVIAFTHSASFQRSSQQGSQLIDSAHQANDEENNNERENKSISSTSKKGLTLGVIGALLIVLLLVFTIMRLKRGTGFTLRSLFSRRTKRDKKSGKRCSFEAVENRHSSSDSDGPATTRSASKHTTTSGKAVIQLDKELEILGLQGHPWKGSPSIDHPQPIFHSAVCKLNQATSDGPIVVLPIVQDTAVASRRYEMLEPPSPLLPPPPFSPTPQLQPEEPAASPLTSRMTTGSQPSAALPWGLESYTTEDELIMDSLLDDHVLVLPSPPPLPPLRTAQFSTRAR